MFDNVGHSSTVNIRYADILVSRRMGQINPKRLFMGNKRQISTDKDKSPVYRILVVDDDPDITLAFKKGLEENGSFLVYTFNDPQQALGEFKANFYNLLLLDIRMPKMNGFELSREFNKIDANSKVCFVTAYETYYEELKKDFPSLAVSCFIQKPIEIDDLVRRLVEELES